MGSFFYVLGTRLQVTLEYDELSSAVQKFLALMEGPKFSHTDMFSHIRMEGRGDHLRLTLYTHVLQAEVHLFGVSAHDPFLVGVPSKMLFEIVKLLPRYPIDVELDDTFRIKCGKIRFKLPYLREDVYPQLLPEEACDITELPYFPIEVSELFHALDRVSYVTHPKADKPYARGVVVRPQNLVATDGPRFTGYPNRVINNTETILLLIESLTRAKGFFHGSHLGGGVFIMTTEGGEPTDLLIRGGQPIFLKMRLGSAKIPALEKALPRGDYDRREINRPAFLLSIQRALIVCNPEFPRGTVELFNGRLTVEARHAINYHREDIGIGDGGEKILFELNFKKFSEILAKIEGEKVIMRYYGPKQPIVFTDEQSRHYNAILPIS